MKKEDFIGIDRFEYAPMIRPKTEQLLRQLVREKQPANCLEIGTFLGYSASCILEESQKTKLISLEKNAQNCEDAAKNLKSFGNRAEIICCDAIDFLKTCKTKFDFIFLDGAKGQYHIYLPILKQLLNENGILMADDILFYGLVQSQEHIKHKHRSIVEHLRLFLNELKNDGDFVTVVYDFEDGVSVSEKKTKS